MTNNEKILSVNGVDICVETFGKPTDPPILLVDGMSASMQWWETALCERIAANDRFVIRYDNRDTGRSTSFPLGKPGYSLTDLAQDALGVLDALGIKRAHIVGRSMGCSIVSIIGLDHPDRVASLTFVSTSPGGADLPPSSPELHNVPDSPDPADRVAVVDFLVACSKAYSGGSPHFDETAMRTFIEKDVARTNDVAAMLVNHSAMSFTEPANGGFADIKAPTLVMHGDHDPLFPLPHGEALRQTIPGAEFVVLKGAGHDTPAPVWNVFVSALVRHTSGGQ